MKKLILILVLGFISKTNIFSQEINKKQWTMFSKVTADWCTFCGGWGWELHKQLINEFENKNTIIWALHLGSSGLTNDAAKDIIANLGGSGQPRFYESQTNMNASNSNIPQKIDEAKSIVEINDLFDPIAGIGLTATLNDDKKLDVMTNILFLSDAEGGNFYLGLYLIEDKVIHNQANQGQNAVHRYVLRNSILPATFGENFANGPIAKDLTYWFQRSMENVTANPENLKVAAIIWTKDNNGKYKFFNANMIDVDLISNTGNPEQKFNVFTNFQNNDLFLRIENEENIPQMKINIMDVQGKIMYSSQLENVTQVEKTIEMSCPSGSYILKIDTNDHGSMSKKLIKN
ncbi:MAG: Omp28-related outer membrane protein [Saprospiraceae bacterium]|nr:Omp28-related outer membrane protein [Saprospiraceae bacterium]